MSLSQTYTLCIQKKIIRIGRAVLEFYANAIDLQKKLYRIAKTLVLKKNASEPVQFFHWIIYHGCCRAVCIVSGGNIDSGRLSRTIQRGLGSSGRLMRFAVAVPDHRSGLEHLAKVISDQNAVLKSLVTEQMWVHSDVTTTWVTYSLFYWNT